jgi:alcohol dehydrogenase
MLSASKIAPQKLIGKRISLADAVPALAAMERSEGLGISVITQF